jgi:hypothetical protein
MPQCQFPIFCCFVFRKSYIGNVLEIGRNKSQSSYFSRHETESKAETEGTRGQPHHRVVRPAPSPRHQVVGPPGPPPDAALPPIYSPQQGKPKGPDQFSMKHTASRRHRRREIGRVQKLFLAPCRRGESPPKAFFTTMSASGVMRE